MKNILLYVPFNEKFISFIEGGNFTRLESDKIYKTLEFSDSFVCNFSDFKNKNSDYTEDIKRVKSEINLAKKAIFEDVIIIKTGAVLTDKEKLLLVRFVNITYKGQYFIVLNDELIYIPRWASEAYSEKDIKFYVDFKVKVKEYNDIAANKILYKRYFKRYRSKILAKIILLYVFLRRFVSRRVKSFLGINYIKNRL